MSRSGASPRTPGSDDATQRLFELVSVRERRQLSRLRSPAELQAYLDATPYSAESRYRSPLRVVRDRRAHCFDGALFAAAMLRCIGYKSQLVDLFAENDDDHVIAVFRGTSGVGAIAKSNFVGLRYREPIYRSLRELVLSYFDPYFNLAGKRTLRGYTKPLDLARFDSIGWMWRDEVLETIADAIDEQPRYPLLDRRAVKPLSRVDPLTMRANLLVADRKGLYRP